ncbi:Z1 domain-containing protein [Serpentinicella alkaliphila]|nr:Z1 domain-containing protein [Serpentinicella alkaliphila]
MQSNSYEKIKDFIYKKLQDVDGVLPREKIDFEIDNTKALISTIGLKSFALVLSIENIEPLNSEDWSQMKRELETHFNVEMDNGIIIQGVEQQSRDTTWRSGKEKQKNKLYYWSRYREYMKKSLPPEVVKTIDTDTDIVMDNIEDPSFIEFSRYGMVVGHVQSGKTANYSGLVCKEADAGYKFIVIIAGGMNNLRNQTQVRLNEAFVGLDKGLPVGVGKLGNIKDMPVSLTTTEQDFNKQDANKNAQALNFDNISSPVLLVIKKNASTLSNVIKWLEAQYKNQISNHAMLLIDDESDYASINTKEEDDPTIINKRLRKLLSLFKKSVYVAYTATPYANIFIDHRTDTDDLGRDLFPRDFIYALDAPSNYFGARKIFLDTDNKHIVEIDDYNDIIPLGHKKESDLPTLPESLYEAMRVFIINVAIRNLRKQVNKHNSMLVHATRFTMMHKKISIHIDTYITEMKKEINTFGRLKDAIVYSRLIMSIKETYELCFQELSYEWETVLEAVCNVIDSIIIREVHQSTSIPLEYRKDIPTNAIVIGGTSLSRGYTLEGLSVSYFLRNTVFYDTLMQMARWFGYREGYEDLCRIYMTKSMSDDFARIIEATEDLIDNLKRMSENKMTPNDFGLAVQYHPDSALQVTARNKQKNSKDIYIEMKLDGHIKETGWLHSDEEVRAKNLEVLLNTVKELTKSNKHKTVGNAHLWEDVCSDFIIKFLNGFTVYSSDPFGINSRMPIDFVKKYVEEIDTKWDVALYSGNGKKHPVTEYIYIYKEERIISNGNKEKYFELQKRQVSSGNAEAIVLKDRKNINSNRKSIREQMIKPLLMLHILETIPDEKLAAFGVSFPGGIKSKGQTVKMKINSVYIEKLLTEEESDD